MIMIIGLNVNASHKIVLPVLNIEGHTSFKKTLSLVLPSARLLWIIKSHFPTSSTTLSLHSGYGSSLSSKSWYLVKQSSTSCCQTYIKGMPTSSISCPLDKKLELLLLASTTLNSSLISITNSPSLSLMALMSL